MKLKFIAAALTLFTLTSCNDTVETVKVDGKYTIDLPLGLTKTDHLNKQASLQYEDLTNGYFVIVFDEPIDDFNKVVVDNKLSYTPNLEGYSEILLKSTAEDSGLKDIPKMKATIINRLKARTSEFKSEGQDIDTHWKIAYLQGKKRYYQVLTWTITEKYEDNKAAMEAIINSFKETDKSKSR